MIQVSHIAIGGSTGSLSQAGNYLIEEDDRSSSLQALINILRQPRLDSCPHCLGRGSYMVGGHCEHCFGSGKRPRSR